MMTEADTIGSNPRQLHAKAWAEEYELIDRQLSPLGLRAMEELHVGSGETVIDIGCGTGQTILQLADRVGPQGLIYGVDISEPLLRVAGQRTSQLECVELIEADAELLDLPSGSVDAVFSRFGVMSFGDPVAAFSNFLQRAGLHSAVGGPFETMNWTDSHCIQRDFNRQPTKPPLAFQTPNMSAPFLCPPGSKIS
ncbi:methyltransferase domain-containing protein [Rhizobium sp. R693]|uniref:class I SAM-dependent methyltransferase n=1 Tax=Rhizobium sp. R693 TaxID=1764276 RepID=UPI001FD97E68|nr:methyltransferase domain-containing protein [Rhizobium sp. R693]